MTAEQATTWAESNKNNAEARLFILHSDDMKGVVQWFVGLGFDVPFIK